MWERQKMTKAFGFREILQKRNENLLIFPASWPKFLKIYTCTNKTEKGSPKPQLKWNFPYGKSNTKVGVNISST